MAATRLRRTFQYPTESDDEDAVEQGMDEQGMILPYTIRSYISYTHPLQSSRAKFNLTPTTRPRTPHLHALRARHLLDTHLHRAALRAPHRPRNTLHPAAHEHLHTRS
jgi:hypothetical protein